MKELVSKQVVVNDFGVNDTDRVDIEIRLSTPLEPKDLQPLISLECPVGVTLIGPENYMRILKFLARGKVISLTLRDIEIDEQDYDKLPEFVELGTFEFSDSMISDSDLEYLLRQPSIRSVNLVHCTIAENAAIPFRGLTKIEKLTIASCDVPSVIWQSVSSLSQLSSVNFSGSSVEDDLLMKLSEFPNLKELDLSDTVLSPLALRAIAKMENLTTLGLARCAIVDQDIELLKPLSKIQVLDLSDSKISDNGVGYLAKAFFNLQQLNLRNTSISDNSVKSLISLPDLTVLEIAGTEISADGKAALLAGHPDLLLLDEPLNPDLPSH